MNQVVRAVIFTNFVSLLLSVGAFAQSTNFVNFEGKQTRPIRLSPDGQRLFAVNTPDSRLSVFDVSNPGNPILIAEIPVGIEPVSVNPLNSDEAWVEFLIEEGILDRAEFERANHELVARYRAGEATSVEFTHFYLSTLVGRHPDVLATWQTP